MFSKSKRFGENIHGASGPGPATYKMKYLFDDAGAQQPKQRARKPQVLPMLLGKKPAMVLCKKPPCKEPPKIEPQNHPANDCNDWSDIFECKGWLANGATGMVFFSTLKVQDSCTRFLYFQGAKKNHPCCTVGERSFAGKDFAPVIAVGQAKNLVSRRLANLKPNFDEMVHHFFGRSRSWKPASIGTLRQCFRLMELLGKTLDQPTTEQAIDNDCILAAINNAAAAALLPPASPIFVGSTCSIPTRTCSRLGCNFLANHGMDEEPYQFPKKPRKSHKSHPSHPLSHCHPALMGWYSAPLLQCKFSRCDAHCMPSTRPYGTCCIMIAKIYGRRGILGIILLVSSIRWQ